MFSIVSMQEVLINLNGADDLFKLFEGPRSKKRGPLKGVKEKPLLFTVLQVWILPSHIMILTKNAQKLLAFDQVPRLGIHNKEQTDLLSPLEDHCGGVLDILCVVNEQEYVLVLLKNGEIVVWSFLKPSYEWSYVTKLSLSKCRSSQIISYVFNEEENLIIWCEKRSSLYCYVFSSHINVSADSTVSITDPKTILHNSLPMHIYQLPEGCCFMPVANKPPGLLLFSSSSCDTITVHMWSDGFDKRYIPTTASDFQAIITTCISLWIHSSTNENKFISIATHPSTKQLMVLQNDLQVYLVGGHCKNECRDVVYLCTLEVTTEQDIFAKQVIKIYPFQRLLLLVMSDGLINIFDTQGGLFLWKTDTFMNNAPRVWIRRGLLPTIGMWNRSGIWNLRPKPVSEQIKSFHQEQISKENGAEDKGKVLNEISIDSFDGQIKKQNKKPTRRIKQGVNRSAEMPTHYLFQILSQWQLKNLSTDIAINIATHIKDTLKDENSEEEVHMEDMVSILDEIKDPVLLVVLFSDKELPYTIRKQLLDKLGYILELSSSKYISTDIFTILREYCILGKQIDACYCNAVITKSDYHYDDIIRKEMRNLKNYRCNSAVLVDQILNQLFDMNSKYFMGLFLSVLLPDDLLLGTYFECKEHVGADLKLLFWKALLRFESSLFERTCLQLWIHAPSLLQLLMQEAENVLSSGEIDNSDVLFTMEQLISTILGLIWLPMYSKTTSDNLETQQRTRIYCQFMQLSNNVEKDEVAYGILLDNFLIDEALVILEKYAVNTQRHYSFFFRIIELLLNSKKIGFHVERLKTLIPNQFNMAELYNVFLSQSGGTGGGQLFKSCDKDLSVGMLKPLLEVLLEE